MVDRQNDLYYVVVPSQVSRLALAAPTKRGQQAMVPFSGGIYGRKRSVATSGGGREGNISGIFSDKNSKQKIHKIEMKIITNE